MIAETRRKGRIYSEIMRLLNEEIGRYIFSVAVTCAVSAAAALWSGVRSGGGQSTDIPSAWLQVV